MILSRDIILCLYQGSREMISRHIAEDNPKHMELICRTMDESVDKISDHQRAVERHDSVIQDNIRRVEDI